MRCPGRGDVSSPAPTPVGNTAGAPDCRSSPSRRSPSSSRNPRSRRPAVTEPSKLAASASLTVDTEPIVQRLDPMRAVGPAAPGHRPHRSRRGTGSRPISPIRVARYRISVRVPGRADGDDAGRPRRPSIVAGRPGLQHLDDGRRRPRSAPVRPARPATSGAEPITPAEVGEAARSLGRSRPARSTGILPDAIVNAVGHWRLGAISARRAGRGDVRAGTEAGLGDLRANAAPAQLSQRPHLVASGSSSARRRNSMRQSAVVS